MKVTLLSFFFFISVNAFGAEHALGAHEHGAIILGMAVEKNVIDLDLDGPTESFISFEYLPKTDSEKKIFNDVKNLWEKNLFKLIAFDKSLGCKVSQASFTQVIDEKETKKGQGVHSDVEAKAKINCLKNVIGTEVVIYLKKQFKNIKKLSAEIISSETKSVEINKPVQSVKI